MISAFKKDFGQYLVVTCLTCIVLFFLTYFPGFDYTVPLAYSDDALFSNAAIKSFLDTHQYNINNPFLSAPSSFNFATFPFMTPFNYLTFSLLSLFSNNSSVLMNLYFHLTYILVAIFALYICKKLGLRTSFAIAASVLYAFIPYHQLRNVNHLFLTNYFVAPLFIYLAIEVFNTEQLLGKSNKQLLNYFWCIFCGVCGGLYFIFFGCYTLLVAGVITSLQKLKFAPFILAIIFIGITTSSMLASYAPTLKHVGNKHMFTHLPQASETYPLKITQLLFPIDGHVIYPMDKLKAKYNTTAPLNNENAMSTLGLVGSIGFIALLLILFVKRWQRPNVFTLSVLNMSFLLLSTLGGLGAIFAYTISSGIRGYNRISVFVSFVSLVAFFLILQKYLEDRPRIKKRSVYFLAVIILIIGLVDMFPRSTYKKYYMPNPFFAALKKKNDEDKKFVSEIESVMPKKSLIYQLPFIDFLAGYIKNWAGYELLRPYFHSHSLYWSYGSMLDSAFAEWQRELSDKKLSEVLLKIASAGYTGLYIAREPYVDNAKKLETELSTLTGIKPIVRDDNKASFYDLRPYINKLKLNHSLNEKKIAETQLQLNSKTTWENGFYGLENVNGYNWHWCQQKGNIEIINYSSKKLPINLSFAVQTVTENAKLFLSGDLINETLTMSNALTKVNRSLLLAPGTHIIKFETNCPRIKTPDPRHLYFRVLDFSMKP